MSKYFYHGYLKKEKSIGTMFKVLTSGGIKSVRLRGVHQPIGFNGYDYISVCKKEKPRNNDNRLCSSFDEYIKDSFCFIISNDIEALRTVSFFDTPPDTPVFGTPTTRYSVFYDEYQVKDEIPVSKIIGIGIPLNLVNDLPKRHLEILNKIIEIAEALSLDIVDTSNPNFVIEYEQWKEKNTQKRIAINIKL